MVLNVKIIMQKIIRENVGADSDELRGHSGGFAHRQVPLDLQKLLEALQVSLHIHYQIKLA